MNWLNAIRMTGAPGGAVPVSVTVVSAVLLSCAETPLSLSEASVGAASTAVSAALISVPSP